MKSHSDKAAQRGEPGYVWRSGQERRLGMLRRWSTLEGRLLDNGCGLGNYLQAFQQTSASVYGLEIEAERAALALNHAQGIVVGVGEYLPFANNAFDIVFSNEVIEHVDDDRTAVAEIVRVLQPGGRLLLFCPNRWYPVETHGIYWRGQYRFGNKPLVNYLPDPLRNRLAPHVRVYSWRRLRALFDDLPIVIRHHNVIFGGYDNIERRWPQAGRRLKRLLYAAERTPLRNLGISHFVVVEKLAVPAASKGSA